MQLFYCPDIREDVYTLPEEESGHCVRVLRKRVGDEIDLIDGKGRRYHARLTDDHPKRCVVRVLEVEVREKELPYELHIAVAPTKNIDRTEWFLEKATEIGISEISLLLTEHSERKNVKLDRLEKVVVSAVKQSLKWYCPRLNGLREFREFVSQDFGTTEKYIAHCNGGFVRTELKGTIGRRAVVLIGPEGDFSPAEAALAEANGFRSVSLGESRLRTETAAVYVVSMISVLSGR